MGGILEKTYVLKRTVGKENFIYSNMECNKAVEDGVSGFLVSPTNLEEISKKIIELLTNDELRAKLERKGYKRVQEKFTNIIMAKNTIDALLQG